MMVFTRQKTYAKGTETQDSPSIRPQQQRHIEPPVILLRNPLPSENLNMFINVHHQNIATASPRHHQSITDTEQRHHQHKAKASPMHISPRHHRDIAETPRKQHRNISDTRPRHPKLIAIEDLAPPQKTPHAKRGIAAFLPPTQKKHQPQTLGRTKTNPTKLSQEEGSFMNFPCPCGPCWHVIFFEVQTF